MLLVSPGTGRAGRDETGRDESSGTSHAEYAERDQATEAERQASDAQPDHQEDHQDLTKRTLAAAAAQEFDKAEADFRTTVAKIDKAGARRVLHPNTAARRKSRLTRE